MIARVWKGTTRTGRHDDYLTHLRETVLPELHRIPGFAGADVLRRTDAPSEFIVITRWASMDAVARFAGADPGRAVIAPAAGALLAAHDDRAVHYEVVEHV